jgi:PASTA domain
MKRLVPASAVLLVVLALAVWGDSLATAAPRPVLEKRGVPSVVGMKLPTAEVTLRAHGYSPRPFNTDTLFGIVVKSHYTVCRQYPPVGNKVRILAQKYGC